MAWKIAGIVAYFAALLVIGALASRRMRDVRDYFAGGKRLGFWSVAFSARATGESAWLLLGLTGMGAVIGVQAFWIVLGEVFGVGGAWLVMSRRFKNLTDRYDSITVPDYLESRFRDHGHAIRLVSAGTLVVFVTIYVSAQIDATGKAFESFLGWNYFAGAIVGFLVVLVYIVSGGFVAVVWSDVFQGTLMFLGLVSLPIIGFAAAGGVAPVLEGLKAIDPQLLSIWGPGASWPGTLFTTMGFFFIGLGFLGSPQVFVRFLALRSPDEIGRGAAVAITWTVLADSGAVLTGMVGRFLLSGQDLGNDGEDVLSLLVVNLLHTAMVGIFIAIVLAAIMSTVDSLLVVASSAVVRDYYQKVRRPDMPDNALIGMSRAATVVIASVALGVALTVAVIAKERTIFWFVIFGWSGIAATFCPTIILSLFWAKFTARAALFAMLVGFAGVPFFKFVAPAIPVVGKAFADLTELPPAFLLSALTGVVISLLDRGGRQRLAGVDSELTEAARAKKA
ncbi:MAG: sodium/proline symporter [Planctomycetota bacterium]|nr:sodium/proline symporter [Planctomycetota bacterium]